MRDEVLSAWACVSDWCAFDLMRGGYESLVLLPLARYPGAAQLIAQDAANSDDFRLRKVAALLAGWMDDCDSRFLKQMLDSERVRDQALPKGDIRRLECQSVVEEVVFSAARWMRNSAQRDAATEVLECVVTQTIEGEYWNTASCAMLTLCRYKTKRVSALLAAFSNFAQTSPVDHPCTSSLSVERHFAQNLQAGNPATLDMIERLLDQRDEAARADLDPESRRMIDQLIDAARRYDSTTNR